MVKGDNDQGYACKESFGCDTVAVNIEKTYAVRCCSDVQIAGWKKETHCDVWTESDVLKQCVFYLEDVAEVSRPAHYSLMTHLHC